MYHTQENRGTSLKFPLKCTRQNAWFGAAYYFWEDLNDAKFWGQNSKYDNYQIYKAYISSDNILDTVFNEQHYRLFYKTLTASTKKLERILKRKPSLDEVWSFIEDNIPWKQEIDMLLACDTPISDNELFFKVPYRKRIQVAVYNKTCISQFKQIM